MPRSPGHVFYDRLQEVLIANDPFAAAQFGDAVFATQTSQHDADFFLRRKLPTGGAPDPLHNLLCRFLHRPGFLSHLRSFNGYDGPEILPSSTHPFCLSGADAGQISSSSANKACSRSRRSFLHSSPNSGEVVSNAQSQFACSRPLTRCSCQSVAVVTAVSTAWARQPSVRQAWPAPFAPPQHPRP